MSVFAGSFSLEAAETVGGSGERATGGVLDVLTGLVERSFVIREGTSGRARYRLHETMREFARCGSSTRMKRLPRGAPTSTSIRDCAG